MLVVDRVELVLAQQAQQVRELERRHAVGLEQRREAGDEVVDVGNVGQDVVGGDEVDLPARRRQLARELDAEEALDDLEAERTCRARGARRRLDAVARDAGLLHVAKKVAVVGRDLADQAGAAQAEALAHRLDIGLGMRQPRRRERAEVGVVVAEQGLAAGVVLGLHQPAALAHEQAQRIPELGRAQSRFGQVGVRRRRAAQVEADTVELGGAMAALQTAIPSKSSPIQAWPSSRGDRSAIGSGQAMARRGSRGWTPPSLSAA